MATWTKADIVDKVELDLDLQEEKIVTPGEMTGYVRAAVRDARAIIENIEADYYLAKAALSLVLGQDTYSLPDGIYSSKIRAIIYDEGAGGRYYEIKRIRQLQKFLKIAEESRFSSEQADYRYFLLDQSATDGVKIKLSRPSSVTSSSLATIWYLREANDLLLDADVCDIPEFIDYIFAHVKKSCLTKMNNGVSPPEAEAELEKEEKRMVDTLESQTADDDTTVEQDLSHYEEST